MNIRNITFGTVSAIAVSLFTYGCTSAVAETTPDKDIKEIAATPFSPVYSPAIPSAVELCGDMVDLDREDMYERFDREITSMAYGHGTTLAVLKRANRYFPVMAPILKEEGVPLDMLYLACIESSLHPTARSGAGAAGFWQIMPATARENGLIVTDSVDQRYDLELATRAACRILKKAYSKYGNWESAAASYNGGMGRISRELAAQEAESAYDLFLNEETSRYMFRLLAMKAIMDNPGSFGYHIRPDQFYYPIEYDVVEVSAPVEDWAAWARQHGTTYMQLRNHNPWIRGKSLPAPKAAKGKAATGNTTYRVLIPKKGSLSRSNHQPTLFNPNWSSL